MHDQFPKPIYARYVITRNIHSKIVILILRKKLLVSSKKLLETSKIILVSIVRILFKPRILVRILFFPRILIKKKIA
jgi:hypothetical protein